MSRTKSSLDKIISGGDDRVTHCLSLLKTSHSSIDTINIEVIQGLHDH